MGKHQLILEPRAELTSTLLPRCRRCHAPHPIVLRAASHAECPQCGEPAAAGSQIAASSEIVAPLLARASFRVAAALRAIAERIQP